jgi:hypothetical protein
MNKTGTTSISKTLSDLNFKLSPQYIGESLMDEYMNNDINRLILYIDRYEAFQDNPFSVTGIHEMLYYYYPNSKFVLTIRDNAEEWYNSLVRFHTNLFSSDKRFPPSKNDLMNSTYINKSWIYRVMKYKFNAPDNDMYNKKILIDRYNIHNNKIINFFSDKKEQLLVINLKHENSYEKFCNFLGKNYILGKNFPHLNKS